MRVQNDVRVTFRVDKELKECAERLFDRMGMNMSTALNVFLRKVVDDETIPFVIGAKKAVFGNSYTSDDITSVFESAVRDEVADHRKKGYPVARYDAVIKRAYLEAVDGTREYINE